MQPNLIVLGIGLVVAVACDLFAGRIPNSITATTLAACLGTRFVSAQLGDATSGLLSGVLGAALAALVFSGFAFFQRGLDWSDVKLLAAVGAGLGWPLVAPAAAFIAIAGAVLAIVFSLWKGALSATLQRIVRAGDNSQALRKMPYSLAIAVGSLWAMWWDAVSGFSLE